MANIRFNLDPKPKYHYINVIYYISPGQRFKMSIGEKIDPAFWDASTQTVCPEHENHVYINQIIHSVRKTIESVRLECKSRRIVVTSEILKKHLAKIVRPDQEPKLIPPGRLSQSSYFKRFHELLPNFVNLKDAYEHVENEWNDHGVQMFSTYAAFRTGKSRYLKGRNRGQLKIVKSNI